MPGERIIYIIGFMGSGKSTAGRKLADALDCAFIDLDTEIEKLQQKSIDTIFSESGEEYFRKTESETLRNLEIKGNTVISTGGGTPCYSDNMDFMKRTGVVIYLKMTPLQLKSRISGETLKRPLLKNISESDLAGFIGKKLHEREPWYLQASIILNGIDPDIRFLISMIENHFSSIR